MPKIMRIFYDVVYDAICHLIEDDGFAMASHVALSTLLAVFPFLIFGTTLATFLGADQFSDRAIHLIFDTWPEAIAKPLVDQVIQVLTIPRGGLLTVSVLAAAYFTINSGLTATVVALSSRRAPAAVWVEHYWPLFPSYLAGASVALLLVLAFREVRFTAIALILPMLLISYLTLRSSFGRLEDSKIHVAQLNRLLLSTVETLATAIDAKDEVTHDHVRRVQQGTLGLARELGVTDVETLKGLEAAALLHDTGKIAVPEHILNKPGKLTPAEFEKMKRHAPIGAAILSSIEFPYPVVPIVRHHHENWDGSGYPDGLKGPEIPLGARILSVVDCFDALTSDRPYRQRMTEQEALKIIVERRGTMYDPVVDGKSRVSRYLCAIEHWRLAKGEYTYSS